MLQLKLAPLSQAFTIITSLEDESGEGSNYTLTVYSNVPFTLDRRKEAYLYRKQVRMTPHYSLHTSNLM
jgi:hypothetical protein